MFIVQTQDGYPTEEGAALIEALRFRRWWNKSPSGEKELLPVEGVNTPDGFDIGVIPVGSIEFINQHFQNHGLPPLTTPNIPPEFRTEEFLSRRVWDCKWEDVVGTSVFVKPGANPKKFEYFISDPRHTTALPLDEPVFVSEVLPIPIASEWRVFVFHGNVIDLKPYAFSEWPVCPEKIFIDSLLKVNFDFSPAFVLDVAVLENGRNVLIEVHNLVATGLYGFNDPKLPRMLQAAWQWEVKNRTKK